MDEASLNLEDRPQKTTNGFLTPFSVGFKIAENYEVKERIMPAKHFIYRCTCVKKPLIDGKKSYSTAVVKVLNNECDEGANVIHEVDLFNWIFTNRGRGPDHIKHLSRPLDCPGNDKRLLAHQPFKMSLDQMKKAHGPFTQEATLRFGIEMLAAVKELHSFGVVHGDIQPKHFAVPMEFEPAKLFSNVYLIDFTQSRPFIYYEHESPPMFKVRPSPSPYYCSLEAMDKQPIRRKDDLQSWFYTMLSLRNDIVWTDLPESEHLMIYQRKAEWTGKPVLLCGSFRSNVCRLLCELQCYISQLDPNERPNYKFIFDLLIRAIQEVCPNGTHVSYTENNLEPHTVWSEAIAKEISTPDCIEQLRTPTGHIIEDREYKEMEAEYKYDAKYLFERAEDKSNEAMRKLNGSNEDLRRKAPNSLKKKNTPSIKRNSSRPPPSKRKTSVQK